MQAKWCKENHTPFKPQFLHLLNKSIKCSHCFRIYLHFHFVILEHLTCTVLCFVYGVKDSTQRAESMSSLCDQTVPTVLCALNALTYLNPHNTVKNILFFIPIYFHLRRLLDPNPYVNDVRLNLNLSILAPESRSFFFSYNFIIVILQCCVNSCTAKWIVIPIHISSF